MGRGRRLGTEQVQKLLISSALSLLASAAAYPPVGKPARITSALRAMLRRRRYARDRDRLTRLTLLIFRRGLSPITPPPVTHARWARLEQVLRSGLSPSTRTECLLPLVRTGR